jgi:hypothetical protein
MVVFDKKANRVTVTGAAGRSGTRACTHEWRGSSHARISSTGGKEHSRHGAQRTGGHMATARIVLVC